MFTYVRLSQHVQVVELFPVAVVNVTRVLINVMNVNEPAIFATKPQPYLATLTTNVIPGTRIIQLQAYDPDEGAVVGYSLTSGLSNTHTHARTLQSLSCFLLLIAVVSSILLHFYIRVLCGSHLSSVLPTPFSRKKKCIHARVPQLVSYLGLKFINFIPRPVTPSDYSNLFELREAVGADGLPYCEILTSSSQSLPEEQVINITVTAKDKNSASDATTTTVSVLVGLRPPQFMESLYWGYVLQNNHPQQM